MTPQEELDLANLRYREIADELSRVRSERQQIANVAKDYINASPEQQANASAEMQNLVNRYNQLWTQESNIAWEIVWATERIAAAQSAVRNLQQPVQQSAGQKRRTVNPKPTAPNSAPVNTLPEWYTEESIAKYGLIGPQTEEDVIYTYNWPIPYNPGPQEGVVIWQTPSWNPIYWPAVPPQETPVIEPQSVSSPILQWQRVEIAPINQNVPTPAPYRVSNSPNFLIWKSANEWQNLYNQYQKAYLRNGYQWITDFFRWLWINPYNYPQGVNNIRNALYQSWVPMNLANAFIAQWYESFTP